MNNKDNNTSEINNQSLFKMCPNNYVLVDRSFIDKAEYYLKEITK